MELQLSSVEIIDNAKNVVSTAHVIRRDALPSREQLSNPDKYCTLDQTAAWERAILIRGSRDWGICIGKWEGFVQGLPGIRGVRGKPFKPGIEGIPGIQGKPGFLSIKFFSLFGEQEWKQVQGQGDVFLISLLSKKRNLKVDLRTGVI